MLHFWGVGGSSARADVMAAYLQALEAYA